MGAHRKLPPIQAAVPRGATAIRRPGCQGFVTDLPAEDVMVVDGVPVTTPLRTGLDLGRLLKRTDALVAVDALLHADLFTLAEFGAAAVRVEKLRGVVQLRWVAENAEPKSASPMETRLRLRIVDGGLPRPQAQVEVRDEWGQTLFFIDLGYEDVKLGLEFDGVDPHTGVDPRTGELRFHRDRRRLRELSRYGWVILTFTAEDVLRRGELLVREVEAGLLERGYRLHQPPAIMHVL
jgi:very-short-patch-repair endonuclease